MLTKRQRQLYDLIGDYTLRNNCVPTYEEMAAMMGLKSKGNITTMLNSMERRGALTRLPNHARAIKLRPLSSVMGVE